MLRADVAFASHVAHNACLRGKARFLFHRSNFYNVERDRETGKNMKTFSPILL